MKRWFYFKPGSSDITAVKMKLDLCSSPDERGRTCDLVFTTDAVNCKFFMMEDDARELAEWILENTEAAISVEDN